MISVVIVFLNNSVWKNYMNTRFFYKKDILADFCSSVKETNERRFKS